MKISLLFVLVLGIGLTACNDQPAQEAAAPAAVPQAPVVVKMMKCEDLTSITIANTSIATADTVAAGMFKPPAPGFPGLTADYSKLPAFCRVTGSIKPTLDSDIRFEMWLPAKGWNGRFMQTGNGGAAGAIVYSSLAEPLSHGYAVANTDTGHQGGMGDFSWVAEHPEKLTDFGYRSTHELTIVGKAITAARYGKSPERSYWNGCSTGGRQGLQEAQRFPDDYDAIIAGSPANNWLSLQALSILIQNNFGPDGLRPDKLGILKNAAIASCDTLDGVTDQVISEPAMCKFDPAVTQCKGDQTGQCLSAKEVAAAKRNYAGVVNSNGEIQMPGTGPGSEPLWGAYASPQFMIGTSYFRYAVMKDPNWDPATLNVDTDLKLAEQTDPVVAVDPDLSGFIAHGGKLLIYHGTVDGLISYGSTVNYYQSVVDKLGEDRIKDNVKFYLVPGMSHCSGGEGAFSIDWLSAMEEWREKGKTPGALPATRPDVIPGAFGAPPTTGNGFTRPACAYPNVARYKGNGNDKDAASFECIAP